MPMIRLIATDMDATLLDDKSEVTPRTAHAVTRAMEAGARFVIASGRMYETARPYAELLNANAPMIAFNGAMACDWQTGAPLFKTTIPAETAREVCAMAEARGVFIQYFPERGAVLCQARPRGQRRIRIARALSRHRDWEPLSAWIKDAPLKLLCLGKHAPLLALREAVCEAFPGLKLMFSRPTYLEIVSGEVDKGKALRAVAEQLGVRREEIAAFGDADNDLGMLTYAGQGYAMANSSEEVLARVPRHARANTDDGVARGAGRTARLRRDRRLNYGSGSGSGQGPQSQDHHRRRKRPAEHRSLQRQPPRVATGRGTGTFSAMSARSCWAWWR